MLRIKCRDLINMHVAGIFDQLLTAMNEDSSDDESAGPSTSMPSSGSRGNVRPSQPKQPSKFEQADLD